MVKKKTYETVRQELLNSLKENDEVEEPGLNEIANASEAVQRNRTLF